MYISCILQKVLNGGGAGDDEVGACHSDGGFKSWKISVQVIANSLVTNARKKLLFQELKARPTLTPGDCKKFHLCASGGLQATQDGI